MTIRLLSAISNGDSFVFDAINDVLQIDNAGIAAASVQVIVSGANLLITADGKTFTLNSTSLGQLTTTNVTFSNGSQLMVGDNTSSTINDDSGNTLNGTANSDQLLGLGGNDYLYGNAGNDVLQAGPGVGYDYLYGGEGNDTLLAGGGGYYYSGDNGDDSIVGGTANEYLYGGAGNDTLSGGAGNDTLDGGTGADSMEGGAGNDTYVIDNAGDVFLEGAGGGGIDKVQINRSYTLDSDLENLELNGGALIGTGNASDNYISVYSGYNDTLIGAAGNDTLIGGYGNDSLDGGDGNDSLDGGYGNDTILAGDGNDTVNGGYYGNDILDGGAGNDSLDGAYDNDTILGGTGDDTLIGGAGNDSLAGGDGNDLFDVDSAGDVVVENAGEGADTVRNTISYTLSANVENLILQGSSAINGTGSVDANNITGNSAANLLSGDAGDDTLTGGAGNDTLDGGTGADSLIGGVGDDTYVVDDIGDVYSEGAGGSGVDTLRINRSITLDADFENLEFTGAGNIDGTGNELANRLVGNSGNNQLTGGAGNDTLDGGVGADTLTGGAGDDTYIVDDAGDVFQEGAGAGGIDTVRINRSFNADATFENVELTGSAHLNASGDGGDNRLYGNAGDNSLAGGAGNDVLAGAAGSDTLDGGLGNDVLDGGAGVDSMTGGAGDDTYVVDDINDVFVEGAGGAGIDTVRINRSYTLGTDFENIELSSNTNIDATGNAGANRLSGNFGSNLLSGGAGNDTLDGGVGNDTLDGGAGADSMVGGAGNDVYVVDDAADVFVEGAGAAGTDTVRINRTYTLATEFENLELTGASAINATGNTANNILVGNSAANILIGGSGADTINGGDGADTIYGGFADTLSGTDYSSDSLFGGAGNDSLDGSYGYDTLDGGTGNDTLVGGGYDDIYYVDSANDVVIELAGGGTDTVHSTAASYTLSSEVEYLYLDGSANINGTGNALNNTLYGNTGNNSLAGAAGNDALYGRAGNDTLDGGTGNDNMQGEEGDDTYYVDSVSDYVYDSSGNDTVFTTLNSYTLSGNVENLVFTGVGAFVGTGDGYNNSIVGGAGNDSLTGGSGNDTLNGGLGVDTLIGGFGNDTFVDDGTDVINELSELTGQGTDTLLTTRSAIDLTTGTFQYFENAVFTGSGSFTATGNASVNLLQGGAGNDSLIGYAGNDTLDGGLGNDTLTGGAGDDTYMVNSATDVVLELTGEGSDTIRTSLSSADLSTGTLQYFEHAAFTGSGNFTGTGNASANSLAGGAGNDTLTGNAGNDTLDGGAGNDSMAGGANDDTYYVDAVGDVVTENASEGTDTVRSSISYILGANQENLVLTGTANINGTGNTLNNRLDGNAGDNVLDGGSGVDQLYGGAGNDTYKIDNASDYISEGYNAGTDRVEASVTYVLGSYYIEEFYLASGAGNINATGYYDANLIVGNEGNNSISGGDGNDTLDGGLGGVDTLVGGYGDDRFIFETGDIITELAGQGTDTVQTSTTYALDANLENVLLIGSGNINATGNAANNVLTGNDGANDLTGGAGNDTYVVGVGDSVVESASEGTDTVQSAITWTLADNTENLTLTGAANLSGTGNTDANQIAGNAGDNLLTGGEGNDTLTGGAGNDTLDGGSGNDSLAGGAGDDVFLVDSASDTVAENYNEGYDVVRTSLVSGDLNSYNYIEGLTYVGGGDFTGTGNSGNNVLTGGAGNDSLAGNDGDDYLDGGSGQNSLYGGYGVDMLLGGEGNDLLDGGYGADYMSGGLGDDRYYADNAADVVVERAGEGYDTVYLGSFSFSLGDGIEAAIRTASSYYTSLTGSSSANRLVGSAGYNETLIGGAGNDTLESGGGGYDSLVGGTGDDSFVVAASTDIVLENLGEGTDTVHALATCTLGANIENLILDGSASINGTGNALGNRIDGNSGNNVLDGGAGNDTLTGGLGNDTYVLDSAFDVIVENDDEGTDTVQTSSSITLSGSIENVVLTGAAAINVTGSSGDNYLTGNAAANILAGGAGNDTLSGGAGNDTLQGGTGNDTYIVDSISDTVTENASEGTDSVLSSATLTLAANVENLTLTGVSVINGTGNVLDNVIAGNTAGNILDGGAGNDTLSGGLGNDTYVVDNVDDVIVETAGQGTDLVLSAVSYTLGTYLESLTLLGSAAINGTGNAVDNLLTGNTGNNVLSGGDGNDTLQGGAGVDTLAGGAGNDTYEIDNAGDVVSESNNEGTDTINSSVSVVLAGNLENVLLTGAGNLNIAGNTGDNQLVGNIGNNLLQGGDGNDILQGGDGNDTLEGGAGDDTLIGGAGTNRAKFAGNMADYDLYSFNGQLIVHDRVVADVSGDEGTDTLTDIEFLQFADATISGKSLLEFRVNTTTPGDQGTPSVVTVPHGFVVYWNVDDLFQRYDNTGQPLGGELPNLLQDATCGHPDFASRPNGGIVVVSGYDDIYLRFFNAEGASVGTPLWLDQTPTTGATFDHYARVDALDGGGYIVVWEAWQENAGYTAANSARIMGRVVSESGEYLSNPYQISQTALNPGIGSNNIIRVSTSASGVQVAGPSWAPEIAGDGRYVVFESEASNLVAGDTNGVADVFLKDVQTGAISRVSTSALGAQGNGFSGGMVDVSADGRYVVFESGATNLIAGDSNGFYDLFVKDMQTGALTCVSMTAGGVLANGANPQGGISADGRYVVFESEATNLVAGDTNWSGDIFRKDLQTGDVVRVSTTAGGGESNGWSESVSVSADGRYVAFRSSATNLVANDTNSVSDIFLKDIQTGAINRVSTSASGVQANLGCEATTVVSADGRYVMFESQASNLVAGDTNNALDVFLKDMQTGVITRVSTGAGNSQAYGNSYLGSLSSDGHYALFVSDASNLVSDYNGTQDAFIKNMQTGAVVRVSTTAAGAEVATGIILGASLSADGRYATFSSASSTLTGADTNAVADIFRVENPFLSSTPLPYQSAWTPGDQLDVTALTGGGFFSTWVKNPTGGGVASVVGRFMNADGTPMGAEIVIDPSLASGVYGASIETAAFRSGVLVTWNDLDSASGNGVVLGRKFDNAGNALGGEFRIDELQTTVTGFGDGKVITDIGDSNDGGTSVTLQADGKILVAGASSYEFAIVRYNTDGSLDVAFDGDGKVTTDIGTGIDIGRSVTVQSNGKILVAGEAWTVGSGNPEFALARYNTDGSLDTSFDGDGKVTTAIGASYNYGQDVAVQADGKILVAGFSWISDGDFALVRYNVNGSLDTSFDGDGKLTTAIGNGADYGYSLTVQADGKILVAGASLVFDYDDFALVRYNADGSLDTSFDVDGKLVTAIGSSDDIGRSVTMQADGKILVAGSSVISGHNNFALVRYNTDGSLDSGFDGDGKLTTAIGSGEDIAYSVAIQADGKILVVGSSSGMFALARYNTNGSLDTSFDGDGKLTTAIGYGSSGAQGVTVQADGKIVVAGWSSDGSKDDFALVRYNANGSLDTSFDRPVVYEAVQQNDVQAANLADGGSIVVWMRADSAPSNGSDPYAEVWGRRYDAQGNAVGNEFKIDSNSKYLTNPGYAESQLDVTALDSGGYVVVWTNGGGVDGSGLGVFAQIFDSGNHKLGYQLTGDSGDNVIIWKNGPEAVLIDGGDGNDIVSGWVGDDKIGGGTGNDVLEGGDGSDLLTGGEGNDWLNGGAGDNRLQGDVGIDTVVLPGSISDYFINILSPGSDGRIFYDLGFGLQPGDIVNIGTDTGRIDRTAGVENVVFLGADGILGTGDDQTIALTPQELLANATVNHGESYLADINGLNALYGNVGNDVIDGFGGDDSLYGYGGNDILLGGDGADTLVGGSGNDALNGGLGDDSLLGGTGNDNYIIDSLGDVIVELAGEGSADRAQTQLASYSIAPFAEVEVLEYTNSSGNFSGTGNSGNNTLLGNTGDDTLDGGDGNDSLFGRSGNDSLIGGTGNDDLDGGTGNDTLAGGLGDDVYRVDSLSDVIVENPDEGSDTVVVGLTYTLASGVENLILSGTSALNGTGNGLDNTLIGNSAGNVLSGGLGNDTLDGSVGADTLIGGLGNDTFVVDNAGDIVTESAGEGVDAVQTSFATTLAVNLENLTLMGIAAIAGTGNTADNRITGNIAANALNGGAGNDTLDGGAGADALSGGTGNDTYIIDNAGDLITENAGEGTDDVQASVSYTLASNLENLTLTGAGSINGTGNVLNNLLTGNSGNNTLDGGAGNDTLSGGTGNDTYLVDSALDVVTENAAEGTDLIQAGASYTLSANVENLTLLGVGNINGAGNALANQIIGNAGNNLLEGGLGADSLTGGAGNDTYVVDDAGDIVSETGADTTDTVQSGISYTLGANLENLILTGTGNINATGNALNNQLAGNSGNNILSGGAGNDTLSGGAGDDIYLVDSTADVIVEGAGAGTDSVQSNVSYTLSANVENLTLLGATLTGTGNAADNQITGNAANNTLDGGAGNDTLSGGAGNDTYVVDSTLDVVIEAAAEGTDLVQASASYTLSADIENLILTGAGNINGTGNALNNQLLGNAGNNVLDGGLGADIMTGGLGDDTYVFDDAGDQAIELATGGTDTLMVGTTAIIGNNIENVILTGAGDYTVTGSADNNQITGNSGNNSLDGGAGNDTLDGGAGNDSLSGGTGNDTYVVDTLLDVISEIGADTADTVQSSITWVLGANLENLTLTGSGNIDGTGNALNNQLAGNSGNNIFSGGAGNDTLSGGAGDDTYLVDSTADVIIEGAGAGTDSVQSNVSYTLSANIENLTLLGAALTGTGNAADNQITGNAANNTLDGGAGNDTLTGGAGNDTYVVDSTLDVVIETAAEGTDLVQASASYTLSADIENLTLTGAGNINGTGNVLNNQLIGNAGNNVLDGGLGADAMTGGAGNDTYVFDDAGDQAIELLGGGIDTLMVGTNATIGNNIENVILTGAGDYIVTGSADNNQITGNSGNNSLDGGAGNDTLDGGAGNDSLIGGAGNDTYVVDTLLDVISETGTDTADTVQSSITWTLGANLENLMLTGTGDIDGTGNALNNQLAGNSGNNTLDGGVGNDTMTGGAGDDTYLVNSSADVVVEGSGAGTDSVQSSATYILSANVENLTLTGGGNISGTGNTGNNQITGNSGNNQLSGDAGNDSLDGGAGADTMTGGAGDDTYHLDNAGDVVVEAIGGGNDTVYSTVDLVLPDNIENVFLSGGATLHITGNSSSNNLSGSNQNDTIDGGAGNDTISGGTGADSMVGGAGNDTYIVDDAGDVVSEIAGGDTADTVQASVTFTLGANLENLVLTGSDNLSGTGNAANNQLAGNAGDNTLDGGAGNDLLNGGIGADSMVGGSGNDTYVVDDAGDVVSELAGGDVADTVQASIDYTLGANLENLVLTGSGDTQGAGNAANNQLAGNAGNNVLDGGAGNDSMAGGAGNDTYVVDSAGDIVTENAGDGSADTVQAAVSWALGANFENLQLTGSGNTSATGNAAGNQLAGNAGNNLLDGGAGNDTLAGGVGNDTYVVDNPNDVIVENGGEGTDAVQTGASYVLSANLENLYLTGTGNIAGTGNADGNQLTGNAGNNVLDGGAGADTLAGGVGNDTYVVDDVADVLAENGSEGVDLVQSSVDWTLGANFENLVLTGSAPVSGSGNALNNQITGGSGSNILDGGAGNDTLAGGAGSDTYYVDSSADVVVENVGEGSADAVFAAVSYTLSANLENLTLLGSGNFNATGNVLDNQLVGNTGNNILDAGAGNDTLIGGLGDDTYLVDAVGDVVSENPGEGVDTVRAALSWALDVPLENLVLTGAGNFDGTGNASANQITGNAGNNVLNGGLGADTLAGGAGNDTYVVDDAGDVIIEGATDGAADTVQSSISLTLAANIENLILTGSDNLNATGNALNNQITGNSGDNQIDGGVGSDTLTGGAGDDIYFVDIATDVTNELFAEGSDTVRSQINWTLAANLENLALLGAALAGTGNADANQITGNALGNNLAGLQGNDTLDGDAGNDTLAGGAGDDLYKVDSTTDVVNELAGEGFFDTVEATASFTLAANIEVLKLLGSAISGIGNDGANRIEGNAQNNFLDGGLGMDSLIGGTGDDTYIVDHAGDVLTEQVGEGTDTVRSQITRSLGANFENLVLTGVGNINGTGNTLGNVITGNVGNNELDGGTGADTLIGGAGNDLYWVDDAGDVVTELLNEGTDTVRSQVSWVLGANLENLVLLGAALTGTGNELANYLMGNNLANTLDGGAGNDVLNGGLGADTLIGGAGDDTYTLDNLGDHIVELADGGMDTLLITYNSGTPIIYTAPDNIEIIMLAPGANNISLAVGANTQVVATTGIDSIVFTGGGSVTLGAGIENLALSQRTGNIGGTGGAENNLLEGNNGANILDGGAGNDTLKGYAGEDILLGGTGNDRLDGGKGGDRMEGGVGDDTYLIDNANDQIVEAAASGTDTVRSWLKNTTLGDNLENLILEGTAKANGIGNDLANSLTGNGKANILTGGAGADTFVFNTALGPMNVDTITDFTTGSDKIALDHTLFGSLSGGWFHSVTNLAQTDVDDHILYDQGTGALYYDADASGGGVAVRFAMVSGMPALSAADLLVV
jgi:uncharacterized delta-60 repeat protein